MRVSRTFTAFRVCLSDTARHRPTPAGMAGLRHKLRHNPQSKRLSGPLVPQSERSARWGANAQKSPVSVRKPSAPPWSIAALRRLWREVQTLHCWPRGFRRAVRPDCPKLSRPQGCESLGAFEAL